MRTRRTVGQENMAPESLARIFITGPMEGKKEGTTAGRRKRRGRHEERSYQHGEDIFLVLLLEEDEDVR